MAIKQAPVLELRGIMKEYEGETILAGCDLSLYPGDFTVVVGASGCGKSTLLSIAGLLMTPSAGTVMVEGGEASSLPDGAASTERARAFGFVFQHTQLIGSLRAVDNVLVPACFGAWDMRAATERAVTLIKRFGLERRAQHFPHQLSVGQKRRVALARALVLDPLCVIADEPTNDLDVATADEVAATLEEFAQEGHAVLCATHDMALARRAKRALRLEDGTLSEIDPASL